jgi:DUF2075 family protein
MTNYKIEHLPFRSDAVSVWGQVDGQSDNWPVVYTISSSNEIYVGETVNAATRLFQHLNSPSKKHLERVQIILNDKFNKSVCLDLESHLIKYFAADGKHRVLNANFGIQDSDYFNRDEYRKSFNELFEMLVEQGVLSRSIPEIVNSNLFKFSPFKSLNSEQAISVSAVLEQLIANLKHKSSSELIIQGDPGTGKTVVAIYLLKLMVDISRITGDELLGEDSIFSDFFTSETKDLLEDLKLGLVVPQQSLRKTLQTVFSQTPGLTKQMVMTPFDVGQSNDHFDLLIVDEAHRLGQRANQSSAMLNKKFTDINLRLFGNDDPSHTQLEWIRKKSTSQILLLDTAQSIKPADLPITTTQGLIDKASKSGSLFRLTSQMRVAGGNDYLQFVKDLFSENPKPAPNFGSYDLRFYDDFAQMQKDILEMDQKHGLSRLLAGFAWPWVTKNDKSAFDIEIQGVKLRWNQTAVDWVNSPGSVNEVGSIHTIQGYDLNYAGVIIGADLGFDPIENTLVFNRDNYFDSKGKENNPTLGVKYSDEDLKQFVINIYKVLMTRGIKGTFVYVSDASLRNIFSSLLK